MKAIHNPAGLVSDSKDVVLYPKDTEKWKQFTTNREKFEISIKKEIEIKRQNECKHIEIEVDSDEDLHNCLECGKKFTAHEYLVFKALDNSRIKFHSYTLKNDIHFLEQEKVQLENFVNDLKSQKHKLSSWITRTKKQNDIKNNDWNATSNGWKIIAYNVQSIADGGTTEKLTSKHK